MANAKLCKGKTNPVARVSFTGNLEIMKLLIEKGGKYDIPTENGNTPLMWASFVGNTHIVEYLLEKGVEFTQYNRDGYCALDLAISRMQYSAALALYKKGAILRPIEEYRLIVRAIFDLDKFMQYLSEKKEASDPTIFYYPKSKFLLAFIVIISFTFLNHINSKIGSGADLVVDTRETWKQFAKRVWNFEPAPLVERSDLPEEKQPHRSIYGKFSCYINGINPYPAPRPPMEIRVEPKSEREISYEMTEGEKKEGKIVQDTFTNKSSFEES